jgi:hypothetical protein
MKLSFFTARGGPIWVKECGVARVALICQVAAPHTSHPNEWGRDDSDRQGIELETSVSTRSCAKLTATF